MIFGSVCSGIEAASVAWHPLGRRAAFLSEIDRFPRAVLAHHYPDVPLHGDFTTIKAGQYDPIDLLVGGTPCQSFSIAGLRGGLDDERGNLALEYLRLAQRLRPRWLVWENVPGVLSNNDGRDFGSILGGMVELRYGFAYRVLDAQHFGVPQRRRRVFVVGYLGDWRPAAAVLFECHSLQGHPPPSRAARAGSPVGTLGGASARSGWRFGSDEAAAGQLIPFDPTQVTSALNRSACRPGDPAPTLAKGASAPCIAFHGSQDPDVSGDVTHPLGRNYGQEVCIAFGGNNTSGPIEVATAVRAKGVDSDCTDTLIRVACATGEVTHTLRAEGFDASEDGTGRGQPMVNHAMGVRRLTPRECERLQGFPDDYTLIPWRRRPASECSDGPRYKALGNSMARPVMEWIGTRIQMVEALLKCA